MIKKDINGITVYEFDIFHKFSEISHAVFARPFDGKNRLTISFHEQLHSSDVWFVKPAKDLRKIKKRGDALVTDSPGLALTIRIADCASILLFDPNKKVIANIHAGWRGLAKKIIQKTVKGMKERFKCKSGDMMAAISPMLGVCCSRFSDPFNEIPKHMHKFITEENHVDLWETTESQLRECGIKKENIENPRLCTFCNPEEFCSYRRNKTGDRFSTRIMLNN